MAARAGGLRTPRREQACGCLFEPGGEPGPALKRLRRLVHHAWFDRATQVGPPASPRECQPARTLAPLRVASCGRADGCALGRPPPAPRRSASPARGGQVVVVVNAAAILCEVRHLERSRPRRP